MQGRLTLHTLQQQVNVDGVRGSRVVDGHVLDQGVHGVDQRREHEQAHVLGGGRVHGAVALTLRHGLQHAGERANQESRDGGGVVVAAAGRRRGARGTLPLAPLLALFCRRGVSEPGEHNSSKKHRARHALASDGCARTTDRDGDALTPCVRLAPNTSSRFTTAVTHGAREPSDALCPAAACRTSASLFRATYSGTLH